VTFSAEAIRRHFCIVVQQQIRIRVQLSGVFTPSAPVATTDLFAGRRRQITAVLGAVAQRGQHAILFGERGVGKTSLANLIEGFWDLHMKDMEFLVAPRITCGSDDTYESVWNKVADEIQMHYEKRGFSLPFDSGLFKIAFSDLTGGTATPASVRRFLELAGKNFIITIDEFDRLQDGSARRLMADTIKMLSDHSVMVTLVLVGVADNVDQLVQEHASITRALAEVFMPRMSPSELQEIVQNGLGRVGMSIAIDALEHIAILAQGLPHYVHQLALKAAEGALEEQRLDISRHDVNQALDAAIDLAQESIRNAYRQATTSPRRGHLYKQVLLACAAANVDDLGYFAPADVQQPMTRIMKKPYNTSAFVGHLHQLCTEGKGGVLQKTGAERRQRFRFTDPLLKPYILHLGLADGMITEHSLPRASIAPLQSIPSPRRHPQA